jgi:ribosomal protein L29
MELHQLTAEEIRGYDAGKMTETEGEIRKALLDIRMDIYTARSQHAAKLRGLKKSLARLLTVRTVQTAAAAKAKPAAAKKPVAAAAPKAAKAKAAPAAAKAKASAADKAAKPAKAAPKKTTK